MGAVAKGKGCCRRGKARAHSSAFLRFKDPPRGFFFSFLSLHVFLFFPFVFVLRVHAGNMAVISISRAPLQLVCTVELIAEHLSCFFFLVAGLFLDFFYFDASANLG